MDEYRSGRSSAGDEVTTMGTTGNQTSVSCSSHQTSMVSNLLETLSAQPGGGEVVGDVSDVPDSLLATLPGPVSQQEVIIFAQFRLRQS